MPKDGFIVRQGTFNTEPADTVSTSSIKRGDIEIPIVLSDTEKQHSLTKKTKKGDSTKTDVKRSSKESSNSSQRVQKVPARGRTEAVGNVLSPQLNRTRASGLSKPSAGEHKETVCSKTLSKHSPGNVQSQSGNGTTKGKSGAKHGGKDLHSGLYENKQNGVTEKEGTKNTGSNSYRKRSLPYHEEEGGRTTDSHNPQKESPRIAERTYVNPKTGNTPSLQKHPPFGNKKSKYFPSDDSTEKGGNFSSSDKLSPSRYKDVNVLSDESVTTGYVASHPKKDPQSVAPFSGAGHDMSRSVANRKPREYPESDQQKLYELVQLERDGLLRAEVTYKKRIKQLEDESKAFLNEAKGISDKNIHLQLMIDGLESNSSLHGESQRENKDLLVRCAKLESENQNVFTENQKLKSDIMDLNNKLQQVESDVEELQKTFSLKETELKRDIRDIHETNAKLESEYKTLMSENSSLVEEITTLKSENKNLDSNLGEKNIAFNDLLKTVQKNENLQEELKQSQAETERVQKTRNTLSTDFEISKSKCKSLENEKSKLGEVTREKDAEMYRMKDDIRKKKATISDLHNQIEYLTKEIERLKTENDELRLQWQDDSKFKEMVANVTEELEKKSETNKKLKKEMNNKTSLIEDLNRELANANATAIAEADVCREKLALGEKNSGKIDKEMKLKSTYIAQLETEIFETKMQFDSLKEKIREIEKKELENRDYRVGELEANHRTLLEENRRLRLLLVESNIEVTNRNSEKTLLSSRLEKLEQKQMDSEVKVRRLQNWVDVEYGEDDRSTPSRVRNNPVPRKPPTRHMTHKVKASRSREDSRRPSQGLPPSPSLSPSLPAIDCKIQTVGYFDIYKQKLKLMKVKKLV